MSVLIQIWHAVQGVVTSADYYTLGAAVIVIIIAGFLMDGLGSLIQTTLAALIGFVLAKFVLALAIGHGHDVEALARTDWHAFVDLKMLVLLAHALIFGVLIAAVNVIRSLVR